MEAPAADTTKTAAAPTVGAPAAETVEAPTAAEAAAKALKQPKQQKQPIPLVSDTYLLPEDPSGSQIHTAWVVLGVTLAPPWPQLGRTGAQVGLSRRPLGLPSRPGTCPKPPKSTQNPLKVGPTSTQSVNRDRPGRGGASFVKVIFFILI